MARHQHVPNPRRAITELARVLRHGGKLLLTTPNYLGTLGLYRMYLRLRGRRFSEVGQPINKLTLLPLTRLWVAQAGLRVIAVDGVGHYLPVPGRPPVQLAAMDNPRILMRWLSITLIGSGDKTMRVLATLRCGRLAWPTLKRRQARTSGRALGVLPVESVDLQRSGSGTVFRRVACAERWHRMAAFLHRSLPGWETGIQRSAGNRPARVVEDSQWAVEAERATRWPRGNDVRH